MKITAKHYKFWCERKAIVSWWTKMESEVSIHELIPREDVPDKNYATQNTVTLLKQARKRRNLAIYLKQLSIDPGCRVRPEKRMALARKWLRKLNKKRG